MLTSSFNLIIFLLVSDFSLCSMFSSNNSNAFFYDGLSKVTFLKIITFPKSLQALFSRKTFLKIIYLSLAST